MPGYTLAVKSAIRAPSFPKTCAKGTLELHGLYVVDSTRSLNESCKLRGSSAIVLLNAPLIFERAPAEIQESRVIIQKNHVSLSDRFHVELSVRKR